MDVKTSIHTSNIQPAQCIQDPNKSSDHVSGHAFTRKVTTNDCTLTTSCDDKDQRVVVLLNSQSGERKSANFLKEKLIERFPERVIDLSEYSNKQKEVVGFIKKNAKKGKVIVAGGDGTVSWAMDLIDQCNFNKKKSKKLKNLKGKIENKGPTIAVISMGTGNDLSQSAERVLDLSDSPNKSEEVVSFIDKYTTEDKVIVAGGDGTVSRAMDLIDQCKGNEKKSKKLKKHKGAIKDKRPTIAVIPMGTGNDFSRSLNMGKGFTKGKYVGNLSKFNDYIDHCISAKQGQFDRWVIEKNKIGSQGSTTGSDKYKMNNYFSVGFDANIAKNFDSFRQKNPSLCQSRVMNKLWYGRYSLASMVGEPKIHNIVKLTVDGTEVTLPKGIKSLVVSNVDSYASGCKLWKSKNDKFKKVSVNDGLLEVQGIYGITHMAGITMKMRSAYKIAQGKDIVIETSKGLPMQWDGEVMASPGPSKVKFSHHSTVNVLHDRYGYL